MRRLVRTSAVQTFARSRASSALTAAAHAAPTGRKDVYAHLVGHHTIGVYPLLADDSCHFLAVDFDQADWRRDAQAFAHSCHDLCVPFALEISRSGHGA